MMIYDLTDIAGERLDDVGGKARGLYQLAKCGLPIAPGFVVVDIDSEIALQAAADHYSESGMAKVAVRSSATAEDGADFSSAGQYATVLDVEGKSAVKKAIQTCTASLNSETASSYSNYFSSAHSDKMCVIVQEMVDADVSGVCFTQQPGDENTILIEAAAGIGEALVSGHVQAHTYEVDKQSMEAQGDDLLSAQLVQKIAAGAQLASEKLETPLDTEWAVKDGRLVWLQARPITVTEEIDPFELDSEYMPENNVQTTCNVGEALPGAATPLALTTTVKSIDYGIRKFEAFVSNKRVEEVPYCAGISNVGNTLFVNLSTLQRITDHIYGGDRDGAPLSICGYVPDDMTYPPIPEISKLERIRNTRRYFGMLMGTNKACRKADKLAQRFIIPQKDNSRVQYEAIDDVMDVMNDAYWLHYVSSGHSGAMNSTLFFILVEKGMEHEEARRKIAGTLEDIDDIESVDILRSLRNVARALMRENPEVKDMSAEQLAEYLKNCEGESEYALVYFIKRHGHRAIREMEIQSKSWHMDDVALCSFLKSIIDSGAKELPKEKTYEQNIEVLLEGQKGGLRGLIKYLIKQARKGVVNREFTKSRLIKVIDQYKIAYRHLAGLLVEEKLLPDEELLFFLTHEELGRLIDTQDMALVKKALGRRRVFEEQKTYQFEEVTVGKPKPIEIDYSSMEGSTVFSGSSVSRGKAVGKARVVTSVEDANQLEKGEIMVASFTDIGWSPYYCMLGALVTEVGSALSHGAVVAREYALPLVSGIPHATRRIKTGDMISVDAIKGEVAIIG